jgi:hypothetical protein
MDEDKHESADDALEETRPDDMFHPDTDEEKLDEDFDSPASPASTGGIAPDDPVTDDGLDDDEVYSEGLAEAADRRNVEEDSDDVPAIPLDT